MFRVSTKNLPTNSGFPNQQGFIPYPYLECIKHGRFSPKSMGVKVSVLKEITFQEIIQSHLLSPPPYR
jgi:hypothetical protein